MAAVISGNGLGLFNSSLNQLGGSWGGSSAAGQGSGQFVNLANGNLILQSQDEQLLFRGLSIAQLRTYNSQGTVGQVGTDGWLTGFERRVELLSGTLNTAGSVMRRHTGDGSYQDFTFVSANTYQSTAGDGAHDTLSWNSGSLSWTYLEGSSRREERYADHADALLQGRLTRIVDAKSDGTTPTAWAVLYDASQRIAEVRAEDGTGSGDALLFTYDGAGRLASISTRESGAARGQVEYGYDAQGRLASVLIDLTPQDGAGDRDTWDATTAANNDGYLFRTTYTYTDASSLRIAQVRQSDGTLIAYTYDGSGRIATVTRGDTNTNDADGAGETVSYSYGVNATTVTDSLGRAWAYGFDASGQLISVTAPAVSGQSDVTSLAYDGAGNLLQSRTVRGAQTLSQQDYQHDVNGNVLWQWDALGNAVQRNYSASNQLLDETRYTDVDPDRTGATLPVNGLTTRFVYDARDRVRFAIDATGAVTEYQYATAGSGIGQQTSVRRYTGTAYAGTYTEAALGTWATATQKANSSLVEYSYDLLGRLAQSTAYAAVDASGNGVLDSATGITRFSYDAQGLLRQQATLHGASRTLGGATLAGSETVDYLYDGMGRLLGVHRHASENGASNDATTVSTTYAYLDSGYRLVVTLDNGSVRTETRNAAGRLLTVTEAGTVGGSTVERTSRNYYDTAGQLRASEDASGGRSYFFYDAKGRLEATVDSTGAVTRTVYDGADRAVQTLQYANRVTTTSWLSAGVVTKATFADIGVVLDASNDRSQSATYDSAGRLATQVDAAGTITAYSYDGAGRLVQVKVTDAAQTAATARTTRFVHDAAGREVARLDGEGYLTETTFDAAGRPIMVVRYATVTPSAQWATGTVAQLRPSTSSNDQTTRTYYDGRGNLIGELDAQGYLSEWIVDEAGNTRAERRYATALTWQAGDTLASLRTRAGSSYREGRSAYNGLGQLVTQTNAEGTVTRYTYDDAGRLVRTEFAQGTSEVREGYRRYNVFDELIGEIDGVGADRARTLLLGGKTLDDPTLTQAQLDQAYAAYGVRHDYDALGRRIESTDAAGNRIWHFHDAAGRPTFVVRGMADGLGVANAQGEVTETRYNAFGQVSDTITYTGRITLATPGSRASAGTAISALSYASAVDTRRQYAYTTRGLLGTITDAENAQTRYTYNAFGEVSKEQLGYGSSAATTNDLVYDRRGLLTSRTEASGTGAARTLLRGYDAFGRLVTQTDGRNSTTTLGYDRIGRQVTVSQSVQGRTELATTVYDAYARVTSTLDASGRSTSYACDDAARSVTVTTPEGTRVVTVHDRHGQTVSVTEQIAAGQTVTRSYVYDKSGRLVQSKDGLDHASTQEFDVRGLLAATVDASGRRVELVYDAAGRVLRRIEDPAGLALTTLYTYDGQGRQLTVTDPSGRVVSQKYDREGRLLETAQDPSGQNLRTVFTYDAQGRTLTVTDAAGTLTQYAYDALGRRTSEIVDAGTGKLNLTTSYAYDKNDNLIRRTDATGATTRYYYDEANRLIFTVDPLGNMTRQWFDAEGRLVASRSFAQPTQFSTLTDTTTIASLDGRLQWKAFDQGEYYVYDQAGRLKWTLGVDGSLQETLYDQAGRVVGSRRHAAKFYPDATLQTKLFAGTALATDILVTGNDATDRQAFQVFDAAGRVRYTVDGLGNVRETFYDDAGRAVGTRAYATPITLDTSLRAQLKDGTATLATLAAKVDAIDNDARDLRSHVVHDSAGRARYSIDANGSVTEYLFDRGDRIVGTRRYATAITVDATLLGKLKAGTATLADIGPRLIADDARDGRSYSVHDAAGRLLLSVDAAGYVRAMSYDGAGRVVAEQAYATAATLSSALRAELVAGTATAASVLAVTPQSTATDRNIAYVRDAAGRVRYALTRDTSGTVAVAEQRYDAAGRVTAEVAYAIRVSSATAPTVAAVAAAITAAGGDAATNQRVTQYLYDADGQVRFSLDAAGYISERVYDGIGRLVEERAYDVRLTGIATEAAVLAALDGARQTLWSSDLASLPFAGLNTTAVGTAGGAVTAANGQLVFQRTDNATTTYPAVYRTQNRVPGENVVYSGELTTAASLTNTYFAFSVENGMSGANFRRASVYVSNGSLLSDDIVGSTQRTTTLGTLAANTTYVIEAHAREGGVEYFVYVKGASKTSGFRFTIAQTENWDSVNFRVWGKAGPGLTGEALYLDNLRESTIPARRTSYAYDAAGNLLTVTDALGKSESYTYDGLGQQLTRTDKLNNTWTYAYDAAGRRTSETSPQVTVATVDLNGSVTSTTRAVVTTFAYDALGNVVSRTENSGQADARLTQYVYDNRGNQVRTIFADAYAINEATGELNATGQNATIDITYDALGRAVVQKDVRGNYSYKTYDALGQLAYEVDQEGYVTGYAYDGFGVQTRLTRYAAPINTAPLAGWGAGQPLTLAQMNTAGVLAQADANNRSLTTTYGLRGQALSVVQSAVSYYKADGSAASGTPVTQYTYDGYGQLAKESLLLQGTAGQGDAVWADTWRYYDAMGRQVFVVDAQGYATATSYNANGDVLETIEYARALDTALLTVGVRPGAPGMGDAVSGYDRATRWTYDALGRRASETTVRHYQRADGSSGVRDVSTTYAYDAESHLTGVTSDAGTTTTKYDALGRVLSVTEPQRRVVTATSESSLIGSTANNLTNVGDLVSPHTELTYDAFGNLVRTRRYANGIAAGQSTPVADAARDQISITRYDRLGRAVMTVSAEGHRAYTAFDAADHATRSWYTLNGSDDTRDAKIVGTFGYDKVGRQTSSRQERQPVSGQTVVEQSESVTYNGFGEIVQKTHPGVNGTLVYGYDAAGRIITSNESGATRNFGYNLAGHQVREWHTAYLSSSQSVQAVTVSYTDKLGRVLGTRVPSYKADTAAYSQSNQTLDRWGNILQIIDARGYQTNYQYNDYNQIVRDERPLVLVVAENGTGSWVRPVNQWYYDALGRLLATRDANGHVRSNEYDASGQLVRSVDALGESTYYAYDVLGNQRMVQNALGYLTFKEYDRLNRIVAIGDYLPGASGANRAKATLQLYTLNENGERLRVRDALNFEALYDYDGLSQLVRSQTAAGVVQSYAYDVKGNKTRDTNAFSGSSSLTDRDGESVRVDEQTWDYDVFGRVIDANNLSGRDSNYDYDAASGQLRGETASGGSGITTGDASKTLAYYANGQLREIVEASGTIYRYEYDAAGNRTLEQVIMRDGGNQLVQTLTRTWYDSHNRVQRVTQDDQVSGKRVFDLTYEYDAVGNRRHVKAVSGYGPDVDAVPITNEAPVVVRAVADRTVRKGRTGEFRVLFSDVFRDAEQDRLSLTISQTGGSALPGWLQATVDASTGEIVFVANPPAGLADQDVIVQLTAYETDTPSNTRSTTFAVRVRTNTTPEVVVGGTTELPKAKTGKAWGQSISVTDWFRDMDVGDKLSLSVVNAGAMPAWLQMDTSNPGAVHLSGTANTSGTYDLQVRATDEAGASVMKTFRIVSGPNQAPTGPTSLPGREAILGRDFDWTQSLASIFADADGDLLRVTATGMPNWMSFQFLDDQAVPALKLAGHVPTDIADGTAYAITFTAIDPDGLSKTTTLVVTAKQNRAPAASNWTAPSLRVHDNYDVTIPISTLFNDPEGDQLFIEPVWPNGSTLPGWLNVTVNQANGTIRLWGQPTGNTQAGNLGFQLRARDGEWLTGTANISISIGADSAPVRTSTQVGDVMLDIGRPFNVTLPAGMFSEPDGDGIVLSAQVVYLYTYTLDTIPPQEISEVMVDEWPSWLNFDGTTRTFSGTVPGNVATGSFVVRISARDTRNNWAGESGVSVGAAGNNFDSDITIGLRPFVNTAPQYIGGIANQTLVHGGSVDIPLPAGAFNEPNGDPMTYTAEVLIGSTWTSISTLGLGIDASTGRITGTASNLTRTSYSARVVARDPQGAAGYGTFTFAVTNTAPTASTIPTQSVGRNLAFNFSIASYFADVNQDVLSFTASGLPTGLSLGSTGTFSGSTGVALGNYTVTVTANDGRGGTVSRSFTLTVANTAPTGPASIPDQTANAGGAWSYTIPAFSDPNGDTLTYTVSGMPSWMSFDGTPTVRRLSGTPAPVGSWAITVTATDTSGASISRTVTVTTPNVAPTATTIPTQRVSRNVQWSYQVPGGTFSDVNGDTLIYSATNLPSGISFDPASRTLSGKVTTLGNYTVTVTANDGRGGTRSTMVVLNVANDAPTYAAGSLPARTGNQGQAVSWALPGNAFSDYNGDGLGYALYILVPEHEVWYWDYSDAAPASRIAPAEWVPAANYGLSINGAGTVGGNLSYMAVQAVEGPYYPYPVNPHLFYDFTLKIVANDPSNATAEGTFGVHVNVAPAAPYLPNQTLKSGLASSFTVSAFSDANGDGITYSASGLPAGLSFNPGNRVISGTPTAPGTYTVTITANDGRGGVTSPTFTLTVQANNNPTAPSIPNLPGTQNSAFSYAVPEFSDADYDLLSYSASGLPPGLWFDPGSRTIGGTPSTPGAYGVTITATDGRGGSASRSFTITIAALPPPNTAPYVNPAYPTPGGWFYGTNRTLVDPQYLTLPPDTFRDNNNDPLTYTILQKPGWLAYSWQPGTGHVFWGVPNATGSWTIQIRAQDPSGATAVLTFAVDSTYDYWDPNNPIDPLFMPMEPMAVFDMGASLAPSETDDASGLAEGSSSRMLAGESMMVGGGGMVQTMASIPVQTTEYWYTYDAENRIKVNNGKLQNGQIVVNSNDADSWELLYDAVGHEVGRIRYIGLSTSSYVYRTAYDLRGNKTLEFHAETVGGASQGVDKEHRYNAIGQLIETRGYYGSNVQFQGRYDPDSYQYIMIDVGGWLYSAEQYGYDADGRLRNQTSFARPNGEWWMSFDGWGADTGDQHSNVGVLNLTGLLDYTLSDSAAWADPNRGDNASGYDAAGRLQSYRYSTVGNGGWYTHTYTTSYQGWTSYQEKTVTGVSTNTNYRTTTNTLTYDGYGRLTTQREKTNYDNVDDRVRYYAYTGDGRVQSRRAGTINSSGQFVQTPDSFGRRDNVLFVHAAGQQQAELAEGGKIRTWNGGSYNSPQLQGLSGAGRYQAGGGKVVVQAGETLASVAQRIYGSSTLWYVLADANGLGSPDATLVEGTSLNAPSVNVSSNDAGTFKPYNPNEAIGSTTPSLPYITPPPKNSCNAVAIVLMVAIAVVVTVFTAGVAAAAMGATMQGGIMATGAAALSGGLGAASIAAGTLAASSLTAATMAAAAVGGFMGSVASQAVGSAMGATSFSWRNAFASAGTAAVTAGFGSLANAGSLGTTLQNVKYARVAASAVAGSLGGYASNQIAGNDASFSWKAIAASVTSSMLTSAIGGKLQLDQPGNFGKELANGFIGGVVSLHTRRKLGFDDAVNYGNIAADAFGNALGNAAVDALTRAEVRGIRQRRFGSVVEHFAKQGSAQGDTARSISNHLALDVTPEQALALIEETLAASKPGSTISGTAREAMTRRHFAMMGDEYGRHLDQDVIDRNLDYLRSERYFAEGTVTVGDAQSERMTDSGAVESPAVGEPSDYSAEDAAYERKVNHPVLGLYHADQAAKVIGSTASDIAGQIEKRPWLKYSLVALDVAAGPYMFAIREGFAQTPAGKWVQELQANAIGRVAEEYAQKPQYDGQDSVDAAMGVYTAATLAVGGAWAWAKGATGLGRRLENIQGSLERKLGGNRLRSLSVGKLTDEYVSALKNGGNAAELARELAERFTHVAPGAKSNRVVLGPFVNPAANNKPFPEVFDYRTVAKREGGIYFQSTDRFFDNLLQHMSLAEAEKAMWSVNEAFLTRQLEQHRTFDFTVPHDQIFDRKPGSFGHREIQFLHRSMEQYKYVNTGDSWYYVGGRP